MPGPPVTIGCAVIVSPGAAGRDVDGMVAAAGDGKETFCRACFDGEYPIEIPEGAGKYVLEDQLKLPTG